MVGTEDEGVAEGLLLGDVAELGIVHLMSSFPSGDESWVATQVAVDEPAVGERLLLVVGGLGEDDDIAPVALLLKIVQGYGVGDAAVDEQTVADGDDFRNDGHGRGGKDPVEHLFAETVEALIDGFTREDIGGHEVKGHGVAVEGLDVERVETQGEGLVGETGTEDTAGGEERPEAAVARVVGIAQVIA